MCHPNHLESNPKIENRPGVNPLGGSVFIETLLGLVS